MRLPALFALTALFPLVAFAATTPGAKKPNIVFILCDDLGYGDIGVFNQNTRHAGGLPAIATPNLDRMAAGGLAMRGMYCPSPVCAPSRASLFTGVTQGHAGLRDNQFDKALENNHTLATVLRQAGYATALIGKWGLQGSASGLVTGEADKKGSGSPATWPAYPTKRGFDYFFGYVRHSDGHEHYPKEGVHGGKKQVWDGDREISDDCDKCLTTDLFTARAKKWIADTRRTSPEKPFFLALTFDTPHAVIELPTGPYPAGQGLAGGLQWTGKPHTIINSAKGVPDSFVYPKYEYATYRGPALVAAERKKGDPKTVKKRPWPDVYKRYATSVSRIDECVGDILALLRDLKIDDNTLVVFTTDNGPSEESYLPEKYTPEFFAGFGPFDGIKRDCWEGGMRVGAIAHWTGTVPGDRTDDAPAQFHDWMTTFADMAGVPAPARADGVSLLPTLTGKGGRKPSVVYSEYFFGGKTPEYKSFDDTHRGRVRKQMQFLRMGDFVGVRYDVKSPDDPFEIYDIVRDPRETKNLAAQKTALQRAMRDAALRRRMPNPTAKRPYDDEPVPALAGTSATPGVNVARFAGDFPWLPKLDDLTPVATETAASPAAVSGKGDACLISGYIVAPADGDYAFSAGATGAAFLRIHDASVLDDDFGRKAGERKTGVIRLKAGAHPFRLYRMGAAGRIPAEPLLWKPPGASDFVAMPESVFGK